MIRALALGLILAGPLSAQERTLVIERFDATIRVESAGTIDVTEVIRPRFTGHWNGIFRTIPIEYRTPQGFNWTIHLTLLGATDDAGHPLKTETSRSGHYLKFKIWVPNAEDATREVRLRYRASNALRFFDDHDELYWNVTGDEWEVPIEAATAKIELPAGAAGLRAIAFNGAYGSTARDALVSHDDRTVQVTMPHMLQFHEGMTAVVGWNKGLVKEPTGGDKALGFIAANWPLVIPIPIFLGMFAIWRKRGRDPRRLPIVVQYDPPEGLTPGEAGTLLDNSVDMRDVTATMVDLAVRGFLRIEERKEEKLFGLVTSKEFVFHRVKPAAEWSGLAPHEQSVLSGIFQSGAPSVELSELENRFYTSLPEIKSDIFRRLVDRGFYRSRPDTAPAPWIALGVFLGAGIAIGGANLGMGWGLSPVAFVVAGILSGIIVIGFAIVMPARTADGARALEKVLGFEEFLGRVEGDRLQQVVKTPELFEKCLPYAMAFSVEKRWARAFQDIYTEPPRWYVGTGFTNFNATVFSDRLSAMSTATGSTMSSAPRSSSGSGFGGGGSSGGGGGGGGGGGF